MPAPAEVAPGGSPYAITSTTPIRVPGHSGEVRRIGTYLAELLRPATGYALPLTDLPGPGGIRLELDSEDRSLGEEGYRLRSAPAGRVE